MPKKSMPAQSVAACADISSSATSSTAPIAPSFEEAMAELERLVEQMEAGELPLEASVAAYQRGSQLVKYCAAQLDRVESQVKILEGDMLEPFAADAQDEHQDENKGNT